MKVTGILLMTLLLMSCTDDRKTQATVTAKDGLTGQTGAQGEQGVAGQNGHSIVTKITEASECECESSGSRIDMFIDLNDNFESDEGDVYQNSLVVCNGRNGQRGERGERGSQGPQGIQGLVGPRGLQGLQGIQGPMGQPGDIGPQGIQGVAGPIGPQGIQGPQGQTGAAGSSATIKSYTGSSCTLITGSSMYVKASGYNFGLYTSSNCHSSTKEYEVSQGESYFAASNVLAIWNDGTLRVITFN